MAEVATGNTALTGLVVIDFETYYDKEYSLSKLTTEEYVRSPLFEVIGVAVIIGNDPLQEYWFEESEFRRFVETHSFKDCWVLCHNTQFDGAILGWRYGLQGDNAPFWLDTLSMARALQNNEKSNALGALAQQFGLGEKGNEVVQALGKHRWDFTPAEWHQYGVYSKNDARLTQDLFFMLYKQFPANELKLIDITLRMFIEPRIVLDQDMLLEAYNEEVDTLAQLLAQLQITEKDLASNDKFAAILETLGVDVPTKISPKTGKQAYAFAKTDVGFQELLNSPDDKIALLCDARLKTKSTLMRTRSQRLYEIGKRGALPVPLQYYGAHTGRYAASRQQAINLQNLKRGSKLRRAIQAPPGMAFCVGDLKQIEVRVLATLSGFSELLLLLMHDDPYALYGAEMFNVPGMTKETHPELRQAAKSALLGAGYGLGGFSFAGQLLAGFMGAKPVRYEMPFISAMGYDLMDVMGKIKDQKWVERMLKLPHTCTDNQLLVHCFAATCIIEKYRAKSKPVVDLWGKCKTAIKQMAYNDSTIFLDSEFGLQIKHHKILLPNGMHLRYPDLRDEMEEGERKTVYGKQSKKVYGGKLTENIVQAVARIVMTDAMLRIAKELPIVLTVHDEIVALGPERDIEAATNWMHEQMIVHPRYLPAIKLGVDGGFGKIYGDIK
jgi:DNA polymerase I-like protein with 3'-5' exonuclease and polymerase domains